MHQDRGDCWVNRIDVISFIIYLSVNFRAAMVLQKTENAVSRLHRRPEGELLTLSVAYFAFCSQIICSFLPNWCVVCSVCVHFITLPNATCMAASRHVRKSFTLNHRLNSRRTPYQNLHRNKLMWLDCNLTSHFSAIFSYIVADMTRATAIR